MSTTTVYAAHKPGGEFSAMQVDLPALGPEDVEIDVEACGICHSDLSMLNNDWDMTEYPMVGGHEAIGRIVAAGERVPGLKVGDRVGVGWYCRSCMHCDRCLRGDHHMCPDAEGTITHQTGGFAEKVRCHWGWAIPVPATLDPLKCGPLLCGGVTVFSPLVLHGLSPTSRVAVVGIGGLGHMAVMFANAWGCEVTAISRSHAKEAEARELGAHDYIATEDPDAITSAAGRFDLILNTINVELPWDDYVAALAPKGVLQTLGAAPKVEASVFPMILGQKSLSSSQVGSIVMTRKMLEFATRHQIEPVTETYAMADINDAFEKLRNGSPRYRLVLAA